MPDQSFPNPTPPDGVYSGIPTLMGIEQKSSFSPFAKSNISSRQPSWSATRVYPDCTSDRYDSLLRPLVFHAEPLAPLRQRDEQALKDMFDDTQVEEIVSDIRNRLKQLCPEPCWDDDSFEFLRDYI